MSSILKLGLFDTNLLLRVTEEEIRSISLVFPKESIYLLRDFCNAIKIIQEVSAKNVARNCIATNKATSPFKQIDLIAQAK